MLKIGDIVEHKGKRYTLILGCNPRRMHEIMCVGIDRHPNHDGYMDIDDAIDLGFKPVQTDNEEE